MLPKAIQEQEDKANELVSQLAKGELVDVIVDDPSKPAVKPEEKPPVKPEETTSPVVHSTEEYDALNQKYMVLQGKYNHETAEMRRTIDQANSTITRQNEMILDLHTRVNTVEKGGDHAGDREQPSEGEARRSAQPTKKTGLKKLNPEDFQGYGPEMSDLVDGFNMLMDENAQLKGTVVKTQETEADRSFNSFKSDLTRLVSDWEVLNYDHGFLNWLEGTDSDLDPVARKHKLQYFVERSDAAKCALFFQAYKEAQGNVVSGAPAARSRKKENIIQPEASAAGADSPIPGADNKNGVTVEEYNQAVKDYTQKRISYDEFNKIADTYQRSLAKQAGRK